MFQTRQDEARTRARLLREELGETLDHAVKAAGHAAVGMRAASARMAPTASRVRDAASQRWEATVAAFNDTTGMSADDVRAMKRAYKQQRPRLPMVSGVAPRKRQKGRPGRRLSRMLGFLAAGMAAGAATAMVLRRRRQQWEEYDASEALEAVGAAGPAPGMEPGTGAGASAEGEPAGEGAPEPMGRTGFYGTEEPGRRVSG